MTEDLPPPIPAATLVLMRECGGGPPELLMMERTGTMVFAAGALVFPGGRVDEDDRRVAMRLGHDIEASAKVAAIRETIEETGIAPALLSPPAPATTTLLRAGLEAGEPFSQLIARHDLALDLDALVPFSRWCPNFRETRRFDTGFFLAQAPEGVGEPEVAPGEGERAFWASAAAVLAEIGAGRARAIFPTRRNLERLARFNSFAEARADALAHPVRTITPWVEQRNGGSFLCIPEDAGYPVTSEPLETAKRF